MSDHTIRMVLAGGGTGGHVYPALAISEIARRVLGDVEFLFVGVKGRAEEHIVPKASIPIRYVRSVGLSSGVFGMARFGATLSVGWSQALGILRSFDPHILVSTGGYSSAPALFAAASLRTVRGRPAVIVHEQNALPGRANRIAGRLADRVMTTFESSGRFFDAAKVVHTGYPVRSTIEGVSRREARERFGIPDDSTVVLAFGGSGGARSINRAVAGCLPELLGHEGLHVIHGTGRYFSDDYQPRRDTLDIVHSHGLDDGLLERYHPMDYIEDMGAAYAAADLVICRTGAGTLAEIQRSVVPAILVPKMGLPHEHQLANARDFESAGGGHVLVETEDPSTPGVMALKPGELSRAALELLGSPDRLAGVRSAIAAMPGPATDDIIGQVLIELRDKK